MPSPQVFAGSYCSGQFLGKVMALQFQKILDEMDSLDPFQLSWDRNSIVLMFR